MSSGMLRHDISRHFIIIINITREWNYCIKKFCKQWKQASITSSSTVSFHISAREYASFDYDITGSQQWI